MPPPQSKNLSYAYTYESASNAKIHCTFITRLSGTMDDAIDCVSTFLTEFISGWGKLYYEPNLLPYVYTRDACRYMYCTINLEELV